MKDKRKLKKYMAEKFKLSKRDFSPLYSLLPIQPKRAIILTFFLTLLLLLLRQESHTGDNEVVERSILPVGYKDEHEFPGKKPVLEYLKKYEKITLSPRHQTEVRKLGDARDLDIDEYKDDRPDKESKKQHENGHKEDDKGTRTDDYVIYERDYVASFNRFRVGEPKLQFLKEFQSPCWLENTTDEHPYSKSNLMQRRIKYKKKMTFEEGLRNKSRAAFVKLPRLDRRYRLRCLPYFMYIGFAKCGSTDFQFRAVINKYMLKGFRKEFYWWDEFRFTANSSLSDYSDIIDSSLESMLRLKNRNYYPGVTGEMTPITMNSMAHWRQDPRNAGLKEPRYLTPYDLHSVLPDVKLIVMMRNPVSRLYSHYNMWAPHRHHPVTPQDFHDRVVASLHWWDNCTRILPVRNCLYGPPPEVEPVEYELSSWWPADTLHSGEIRTGLYYLFLKDWFDVFPRKQFLLLRTEDYGAHKVETLNGQVYPFLNIPPVTDPKEVDKLEKKYEAFKQTYEPMLNETRQLLENFYQPYSDLLAKMLGDDKWSWRNG